MFQSIELGIQRAFSSLARVSAARPLLISLSTLIVLIAFGFGVFNVEVETDVLKLWVDDSTSLINVRARHHTRDKYLSFTCPINYLPTRLLSQKSGFHSSHHPARLF